LTNKSPQILIPALLEYQHALQVLIAGQFNLYMPYIHQAKINFAAALERGQKIIDYMDHIQAEQNLDLPVFKFLTQALSNSPHGNQPPRRKAINDYLDDIEKKFP
jgi:hypothetical protein